MVLYFSGTGNSRYVAERIAAITGDKMIVLNERIKKNDCSKISDTDKIVFVTPTYGWRIPRIVRDWIQRTGFRAAKAWFVMTCGSEIGNAAKYNRQICEQKGIDYQGTAQIIMPENFIAMFNVPIWSEAEKIIVKAEPDIDKAANAIKDGVKFSLPRNNIADRAMSGIVNPVFYKFFVKADDFLVNDTCISCGKCVSLCPLNNITLKDGKPVWGSNCTQCMACICYCPVEAIEYGKKSIGKPRYQCKK